MWHDIAESPFGQVMTVVYATPISKGKCRTIVRLPFRFKSAFPRLAFKLTPRWFSHLNQMSILEDDQIFLHLQERAIADSEMSYNKTCYLPTSSDRFVIAYRQWVETYGQPFPHIPFEPAETKREILLERYHSHTEHCQSCQTALTRIQSLKKISLVALLLLWIALPFGIVYQLSPWQMWGIAAIIPTLAAIWWKLGQLESRFSEGEYPPSRNLS